MSTKPKRRRTPSLLKACEEGFWWCSKCRKVVSTDEGLKITDCYWCGSKRVRWNPPAWESERRPKEACPACRPLLWDGDRDAVPRVVWCEDHVNSRLADVWRRAEKANDHEDEIESRIEFLEWAVEKLAGQVAAGLELVLAAREPARAAASAAAGG